MKSTPKMTNRTHKEFAEYLEMGEIPQFIIVDEYTPKKFNFDFNEIVGLFKEKFSQLKSYISQEWKKLTHKEREVEKRENTLNGKEKLLDERIERFRDKEVRYDTLDKDLAKYKAELYAQIEPMAKARFPDNENTKKVLDYWKNEASLEQVLSGFNKNFLGYDVDAEKLAKVNNEIADSDKALEIYARLYDEDNYLPSADLEAIRNLGFKNPADGDEWSYEQRLMFVQKHNWHPENLAPEKYPWKKSAIEVYRKEWIEKKKVLTNDKSNFVSKLHNTVKRSDQIKEARLAELTKQALPIHKGPTFGL